jgi:23S rRNA (uracil1939-C5)-methyltransferase
MTGNVQAVAKGGTGIIRLADRTVFVPGVIAGETIEFSIQGRQKGVWQGELLRIIQPSPQRVEAPCRHYRECGGCNLQHMAYPEQLRCKKEILDANLKKIAGIDRSGPAAVLPSPPFRYRSKIGLQVKDSAVGFFKKRSHQLVTVSQCLLLDETAERFVTGLPPFPAGTNGELQVLSNGTDLAARLETKQGAVRWLTSGHSLLFDLAPFRYRIGPGHFIQANRFLMRPMLQLLEENLPGDAGEVAADLFCGCGFFTLPLARRFARVLALENEPGNLDALRANLRANQVTNVEVRPSDALRADLPALDLIVLDPPRGGLTAALIDRVARAGARRVIYFSCDSATFARDLRFFLRQGYGLRELMIIDNFPQSDHFEIFSLLEKTA